MARLAEVLAAVALYEEAADRHGQAITLLATAEIFGDEKQRTEARQFKKDWGEKLTLRRQTLIYLLKRSIT